MRYTTSAPPVQAPGDLDAIGLRAGTDKSSKYHGYLTVYEQHVAHLRNEDMTVLEVGVHKGASTRMWEEYFPNAQIVGVDISPACKELEGGRIRVELGDQGDLDFIGSLADRYSPRIIIEDGSHRWGHQITSFEILYPVVEPGGVYVVEDIHTSFGSYIDTYSGGHPESAFDYVAQIARGFVAGVVADPPRSEFEAYCRETFESVTLIGHAVIIRKKPTAGQTWRRASLDRIVRGASSVRTTPYDRIGGELYGANGNVVASFDRIIHQSPVDLGTASSGVLENATTLGAAVLTSSGEILEESINCIANVPKYQGMDRQAGATRWVARRKFDPSEGPKRAGRTPVFLKSAWDSNYGHWLVDAFAKLSLLPVLNLRDKPLLIVSEQRGPMKAVVSDCLELAGFGSDDVAWVGEGPWEFDSLGVLGSLSWHPTSKAPEAIQYLEHVTRTVEPAGSERIYVSRNAYGRRRLLDEDRIVSSLSARGFEFVNPEKMTFLEQVATFKAARVVVGNMGAALSNLAFSKSGVQVAALATEAMPHDFFYDIVCHKRGSYLGVQGESGDAQRDMSSDFSIGDVGKARLLEWVDERI